MNGQRKCGIHAVVQQKLRICEALILQFKKFNKKVIYTYNGIPLSHKKEWNNVIFSNTDEPRVYCSMWNKSERERRVSYDTTYKRNLKYDTNELIYTTETDSHS